MVEWNGNASWRVLTVLQCMACLPLACVVMTPWMAESPRYLVKKGKRDQALRILADMHANGDQNDELVRNEFQEILVGVEVVAGQSSSFSDFVKTKGNRKRLYIVIWFSWALSMSGVRSLSRGKLNVQNGLFAYYLPKTLEIAGISSFVDIQLLSAGLTLWLLIVSVVAAQSVERLGRRKLLLYSMVGLIIFFALITALSVSIRYAGIHRV